MEQQESKKKRGPRSPNYPSIPLKDAIEKVKVLYKEDGKAGAAQKVVLAHLGYSTPNGAALRMLSALKSFDLISFEDGRIMLAKSALNIIIYSHDTTLVSNELKKLALKPRVFGELYAKYKKNLPSDKALAAELEDQFNFNPNSISDFIKTFRLTLQYAGLLDENDDFDNQEQDAQDTPDPPTGREQRTKEVGMIQGASQTKSIAYSLPVPLINCMATISFDNENVQANDLEMLKQMIDFIGKSFIVKKEG